MSLALDFYSPGKSWLHQLDPRVKLWGTLLGVIATLLLPTVWAQALFLAGIHLVLYSAGIPWRMVRWLWTQMAVLTVFIVVLQPFFSPSGAVWLAWGPLRLTQGGVESAARLALRALNMAFVTGGLLFTTDQRALVRAFVRLGLPYTWGLTLSLTLRFLPAIQSLFVAVREAQAARGWTPRGNFFRRARDYSPVLVAVIIGTLRLSDQLTLALAARGLGVSQGRSVWREIHMQRRDWVVGALITVAFAALLAGYLF